MSAEYNAENDRARYRFANITETLTVKVHRREHLDEIEHTLRATKTPLQSTYQTT